DGLADGDYYQITIKKRGVVDLHAQFGGSLTLSSAGALPSLDGEIGLRIYRESVTPSNQVAGAKIDPANRSRSISFGVAPGSYIIFVDSQQSTAEVRQLTYELSVAFSSGNGWEFEPNNDGIMATSLSLNQPVRGTSWSATDTDWYRIDVNQTGLLIINFLRESLAGETAIALRDAGGRTLTTSTQPSGIVSSLSAAVSRGNYFVEVTPQNVDAFSDYHLMATQIGRATFSIDDGTGSPPKSQVTLGDRLTINVEALQTTSPQQKINEASFSLEGIQSGIPLLQSGDDGVYRATFAVPDGLQLSDVPVAIRLIDDQRVAFDFELTPRLEIDSRTSPIASIEHDATSPLVEGKTLTVTLKGSPDASVTFEIIDAETEA
ncbi:MAG: hypothetical protein AAB393_02395, partial [Bacteroidota bacterium]